MVASANGPTGTVPSITEVFDTAYWNKICPHLQISPLGITTAHSTESLVGDTKDAESKEEMVTNGYFLHRAKPETQTTVADLALGIAQLHECGWPATFILIFDSAWELANEMSSKMERATGNKNNGDILAWYVDASKGHSGFSPHRDRIPDNPMATFRPDGTPLYASAWVALSDAHERNSCLHMVPKYVDPGYAFKESTQIGLDAPERDSQERASEEIETLAWNHFTGADTTSQKAKETVRAVPCNAGDAIFFSHTILHWGSRGQKDCEDPRISLAVACADSKAEPAYFDRELHLPYPCLHLRVALAAGQMISYYERFHPSSEQLILFHEVFELHQEKFDTSYRVRVNSKFRCWQEQQEKERRKQQKAKNSGSLTARIKAMKEEQRQLNKQKPHSSDVSGYTNSPANC